MDFKEGLSKYRENYNTGQVQKRKHYYCVKTIDNGDIYLYAEKQIVNEAGALVFMNTTPNGEKPYPVMIIGPAEYVMSYAADEHTNRPLAEA